MGLKPTRRQINAVKYRFSYSIFHNNYNPYHRTGKTDLEYQLDLMIWDEDLEAWKDPNYILDVPKKKINEFIFQTPKGPDRDLWKNREFMKPDLCYECGINVHKPRKRKGKRNSRMPKYCLDCKDKVHERNIKKGRYKRRQIRSRVGLMGELTGHRFKKYLLSIGKGNKKELSKLIEDPSCVWTDQDSKIEKGIRPKDDLLIVKTLVLIRYLIGVLMILAKLSHMSVRNVGVKLKISDM